MRLIRLLHDGMTRQVLCSGDQSAAFAITNGVKQGCVLAPVLFNLFFACMLAHAVHDMEEGVYIRFSLDGSLIDLRRLNAKAKCLHQLIQKALFADDCALQAHKDSDLQMMLVKCSEASTAFGLTISPSRAEVLHQPAPNTTPVEPPYLRTTVPFWHTKTATCR